MNGHTETPWHWTLILVSSASVCSHFPGVFCNLPSPFSHIISQVELIASKHYRLGKHFRKNDIFTYFIGISVTCVSRYLFQLNDAYEEVDEQRQVVSKWKQKTQKVNGELNDTKLLLEEQTSRNVLLEKKQRKFDAEIGLLHEDKKTEMTAREKLQREVDALKAQKYGLEEQIHVSSHQIYRTFFFPSEGYL